MKFALLMRNASLMFFRTHGSKENKVLVTKGQGWPLHSSQSQKRDFFVAKIALERQFVMPKYNGMNTKTKN